MICPSAVRILLNVLICTPNFCLSVTIFSTSAVVIRFILIQLKSFNLCNLGKSGDLLVWDKDSPWKPVFYNPQLFLYRLFGCTFFQGFAYAFPLVVIIIYDISVTPFGDTCHKPFTFSLINSTGRKSGTFLFGCTHLSRGVLLVSWHVIIWF